MHNPTNGFELLYLKWLKIFWWNSFAQKILLKREVVLIKLCLDQGRTEKQLHVLLQCIAWELQHSPGWQELWAWMNISQLHVPGSWVFWGRLLSTCPIETVLLCRKEILISPEKAGFKSLFGWSCDIYGVQRSSSSRDGGMPSSLLAGDLLRSQPGLEESHLVPVDSP